MKFSIFGYSFEIGTTIAKETAQKTQDPATGRLGLYRFTSPPHTICLRDSVVEVMIISEYEKYYRVQPVQTIVWKNNLWKFEEETPKLIEKSLIEFIVERKPVPPTLAPAKPVKKPKEREFNPELRRIKI